MIDDASKQQVIDHIKYHHEGFPTDKTKLVAACNNMSEFSQDVKDWFAETLAEGTYNSGEEVIKALGWETY